MSPSASHRLRAVQAPIIPVIADLIRAHPGTLSLGQGVVGYGPPPEAFAQLERFAADPANHKYQPVGGIPALLDAIETKLARENQLAPDPARRVMVTAGANQAFLNAVLALVDPGDEVILPTPYYFNQEMAVTMAGGRPVLVPTDDRHQLDLDRLRAAITPRTRALVTVSPNNPTGAVYPEADLRAVNALCAEHGIYHVHDAAYEHFTYDGARAFAPASIPGATDHTVSLFSLSKAYGFASWRIGWMVFPAGLESALRKIQDTVLICPPVISQYAALGALAADPAFLRAKLAALTDVRAVVAAGLRELADVCEVPPAQGAFYFLLRVRTQRPALELATALIREHRVAVIPGNAFGIEHGCQLRVSYGALDRSAAAEGIARLGCGLRALAPA